MLPYRVRRLPGRDARCPSEGPFKDRRSVALEVVLGLGLVRGFEDADVDVVGRVRGEYDGGGGFDGLVGDLQWGRLGRAAWGWARGRLTSRTCLRWVMEGVGMLAGGMRAGLRLGEVGGEV